MINYRTIAIAAGAACVAVATVYGSYRGLGYLAAKHVCAVSSKDMAKKKYDPSCVVVVRKL